MDTRGAYADGFVDGFADGAYVMAIIDTLVWYGMVWYGMVWACGMDSRMAYDCVNFLVMADCPGGLLDGKGVGMTQQRQPISVGCRCCVAHRRIELLFQE